MTDIKRARDVLATWKRDALRGPWEYRPIAVGRAAASPELGAPVVNVVSGAAPDVRLIVGTAGNPDLLDAINALLVASAEFVSRFPEGAATFSGPAWDLAAAILTADERMNA